MNQKQLTESFDYNEGQLIRKRTGLPVGTVNSRGYKNIGIGANQTMLLSRAVWIYHNGDIPEGMVLDHRDGDRLNDRIENLRLCTRSQNNMNRSTHKNSKTGIKGVSWFPPMKKYRVQVYKNRQCVYRAYFDDLELADLAAIEARELIHGDFARS